MRTNEQISTLIPTNIFEKQNYVKEAPLIQEIAEDTTRTNKISYWRTNSMTRPRQRMGEKPPESEITTLTEHQSLGYLVEFLSYASEMLKKSESPNNLRLANIADNIKDRLNYIGERELAEASEKIAESWKYYLEKDPKNTLCVPQEIIRTGDYEGKKSSEILFDRVMSFFTEEEREKYKDRISTNITTLKPEDADTTKVILLDDWSISGVQLENGFGTVFRGAPKEYRTRMEVNLIAATEKQLNKLTLQGRSVPIHAYFKIQEAPNDAGRPNGLPMITGSHSSVDFGFEKPIQDMVTALNNLGPETPIMMPPCTNILREYRQ